jgi:thiosulfate/3-mercaptopyruvate sulfurtransferase
MPHSITYKKVKRRYLEMDTPPAASILIFPPGVIIKPFSGTLDFYRALNRNVGEDCGWVDRQIMPDKQLSAIIDDNDIQIFVLYCDGEPCGYLELNCRNKEEVFLEYFGLFKNARGKGLGKFLLDWTIQQAWRYNPKKFKLHTSDQDHPRAFSNYLDAGFKLVDEKWDDQAVVHYE